MQRCGQGVGKPQEISAGKSTAGVTTSKQRRKWYQNPETDSAEWRDPFDRTLAPEIGGLSQWSVTRQEGGGPSPLPPSNLLLMLPLRAKHKVAINLVQGESLGVQSRAEKCRSGPEHQQKSSTWTQML